MLAAIFSKDGLKWLVIALVVAALGWLVYKVDEGAAAIERVHQLEQTVQTLNDQAKTAATINEKQKKLADEAADKKAEAEGKLNDVLAELDKQKEQSAKAGVPDHACIDRNTARKLRGL